MSLLAHLVILAGSAWPEAPDQPGRTHPDWASLPLEQLMDLTVEGATLHRQTLQEAPASVTVLTADDIYKYGYRTLGEALASVRGFYTTNDRTYRTVGVRGFGLPGDYASRILVMVNGHNMADNVFDSMLWFGVDFPIDMSLVQRIEIIRGPSSALYGSNGIFATVNVITKSPDEIGPLRLTLDAGSFGEKKSQITAATDLGREAKILFSGSVFSNAGESPLFFPQFNAPETNFGRAVHMDAENGYHFFTNLSWRNWSFTAALSKRTKIQPISWGPTVFNDPGTKVVEPLNYGEAVYTRERDNRTFRWRAYYSQTHLRGRFDFPLDAGIEDNRSCSCGDWIGSALSYRFGVGRFGVLTAGAETKIDLRVLQSSRDVSPVPQEFVYIHRRDRSLAVFAQDELTFSSFWKLDLGLRVDASAYRPSFLSPRAALIYQPSAAWTYKLLYGRAFRNPNAFDLFFEDGISAAANPRLRPENVDTVEVNVEHRFSKRWSLLGAVYGYWLRDFQTGAYNDNGLIQFQNLGGVHAAGVEWEINGHPLDRVEVSASYAVQRATDALTGAWLPNSANQQAKLRLAVPVGRKLYVSSSMRAFSSRKTMAGALLDPAALADFTLSTRGIWRNFDVQFGIRNAFDHHYTDPVALNPRLDSMPQPGRAFFIELIAHPGL
ncbi:MAG TPA: TonB-dependent receptor [Bryobacteraceae bacterium]|nr:TonB-dependent receptor [Bryobacteraceae bacterium]